MSSGLTRVLVGMPTLYGKPEPETARGWSLIESNPRAVPGFELIPVKAQNYSAGTARNTLILAAKEAKCSRILFIDADMVFTGSGQVARILSHNVPVVGANYPKRCAGKLAWTATLKRDGATAGELAEAVYLGAGFLSVSMEAIATIERCNPALAYVCAREDTFGKMLYHLFSEQVVQNDWSFPGQRPVPQLLMEDQHFCHLARKAGIPVFVDTKCQVGHMGTVDFLEVHKLLQAAKATPALAAT